MFEELQEKINENEEKDDPKEGLFVDLDLTSYRIPEIERLPTLSSEHEEPYDTDSSGEDFDSGDYGT